MKPGDAMLDIFWLHTESTTVCTLHHLAWERHVTTSRSIAIGQGHQTVNAGLRKHPSEERLRTVKGSLYITCILLLKKID